MTSSYRDDVIGCFLTRGMWFSSPGHGIKRINYEQFILLLSTSRTPVHLWKDYVVFHMSDLFFWIVQIYIYIFILFILETLERKPNNCLPLNTHCQIVKTLKSIMKRQWVSGENVWREEWTLTDFYWSSRSLCSCYTVKKWLFEVVKKVKLYNKVFFINIS